MKIELKNDVKLHPLVCSKMYLQATGRILPEDFLIISEAGGLKTGLKPVRDYKEGRELIDQLSKLW